MNRVILTALGSAWLFGASTPFAKLMTGLAHTPATTASLLLNFESLFTVLLAWFAFGEHFDRRIAYGMALILAGGVLLSHCPDLHHRNEHSDTV
jgi:drug/metabolite transporter (DMT)-like permease